MSIYFGADYYPEHWPEERWEKDAQLMEEIGLNVVRMAEFSWAKMEPRLGEFNFEWLDRALDILGEHGVRAVLGTPTPTPPAWIVEQTPEIFPIDKDGRVRGFGGRHHDCQSNPVYRAHIRRFVTAMAEHFKDNPNVIGWQIDNELGTGHQDTCMCDSCRKRFQEWLEKKYGTIEELNRAWGTCFWSQDYNSFSQIYTPKITFTGENPSAMLDWRRFTSDLVVEFQQFQIDIIRSICPNQFITHNFMGFADNVSYYDLAKSLNFVCHDQYPGGFFAQMPHQPNAQLAATLDLMRSVKHRTYWIMEQQAGITGWQVMGRAPQPGQLAMWAQQSIAHGADCIVFFRWRTCAVGTEQYWHGILPHSGRPGRRYNELRAMISAMQPVMEKIQGSVPKCEVGIVYSYDQEWAMTIQPHHPDLHYIGQVVKYYRALYDCNIPVDFLSGEEDFSPYKLIIAPLQYILTPEQAEKYRAYVKNGGHLVMTMRTGVKDATNLCMTESELPGLLSDVLGIEIPEYDCLQGLNGRVRFEDGGEYDVEKWSDMIELHGAQSIADYAKEFYAGTPAVTCNAFGSGRAYYVGSEPSDELMDRLCGLFVEGSGVASLGETPEGVEITHRHVEASNEDIIFVINHNEAPAEVSIPSGWDPVLAEEGSIMKPFEVRIYSRKA